VALTAKSDMRFSRRSFLATAGAAVAGSSALYAAKGARLRIGITDWNLHQTAKLEAVALAKKLGFDARVDPSSILLAILSKSSRA
jgi:ABC-type proline/glycine betaine transport system substrate-binding protein